MDRGALSLVMPMAGRGSRFAKLGVSEPKPLIDLEGRPFFWWAVESLRRTTTVGEMVFVVLEEHCRDHAMDKRIKELYPRAKVVAIPDVTSGAAETARFGVEALSASGPLAVNDCDHAFVCSGPDGLPAVLDVTSMALLCFRSDDPAYSYVVMDSSGRPAGTVEKKVVSSSAIAGCYFFQSPQQFLELYEDYRENCPYDEMFVSGMFNHVFAKRAPVRTINAEHHWSFGTPKELERLDRASLRACLNADRA